MGKRSNFERIPRDFYPTPFAAVLPLIPHLRGIRTFAEPCCGDGALVRHVESFGLRCVYSGDIATGQDALARDSYGDADAIITNTPYTRELMRKLIEHFLRIAPTTWLLLPADWMHNRHAGPFLPSCTDVVSVGRVRWIEGTKMSKRGPGQHHAIEAYIVAQSQRLEAGRAGTPDAVEKGTNGTGS
jgi:hypothetical protein